MQLGRTALPTAEVQPLGNPPQRQRRFPTHSRRQGQFGRVALGPLCQIALRPPQTPQLFPDDPFGLRGGALPLQLSGMVLAQLAFHPLQQLGLELRRTHAPAPPQRLPPRAIGLLRKCQTRVSPPVRLKGDNSTFTTGGSAGTGIGFPTALRRFVPFVCFCCVCEVMADRSQNQAVPSLIKAIQTTERTDDTEGETLAILPDSVWFGYSVVFRPSYSKPNQAKPSQSKPKSANNHSVRPVRTGQAGRSPACRQQPDDAPPGTPKRAHPPKGCAGHQGRRFLD